MTKINLQQKIEVSQILLFFLNGSVGSQKVIIYPHICWIFLVQCGGGCMGTTQPGIG